ncbi:MAG: zinc ribbon domain-containing protein [Lachnospiraceae bacterium]|nr:zinc ribbon domain-containing protein [Lachnospiraceae bacterium]
MFILYGTRRKIKIDRSLGNRVCPNCHHTVEQSLAREKAAATIFFIPVFGWTTKRMIYCPCCGTAKMLSRSEYKEMKKA